MKTLISFFISFFIIFGSFGSEITGLIEFQPNTTAKSGEVNQNFNNIKNAVNDNNSRISDLENTTSQNQQQIMNLQNAVNNNNNKISDLENTSSQIKQQINLFQNKMDRLDIVFMYLRERALKCTALTFMNQSFNFNDQNIKRMLLKISKLAKTAVDDKSYENESDFSKSLNDIISNLDTFISSAEKNDNIRQRELDKLSSIKSEIESALSAGNIEKAATLQDEICFYINYLKLQSYQIQDCETALNCIHVSFKDVSNKFGSPTASEISTHALNAKQDNVCQSESQFITFVSTLKFNVVLSEISGLATNESYTEFDNSISNLDTAITIEDYDTVVSALSDVCDKASNLERKALITVPNVVGLTLTVAEIELTNAGLTVGTITKINDPTNPPNTVLSQSPKAGTKVTSGTPVDLTVSK